MLPGLQYLIELKMEIFFGIIFFIEKFRDFSD